MAAIPKMQTDLLPFFRQRINELFRYLSTLEGSERGEEYEFTPLVDIYETATTCVVEIEAPGLDRTDITLKICSSMLIIEGSKREEKRSRDISYVCLERRFGRVFRAIEIPVGFDPEGAAARYENGLLTVVFPRRADLQKVIREIPIE